MKARLDSVAGRTEHPQVNEWWDQARAQYNQARGYRDRGDFVACSESLEQAEVYLDKAQRLRRELAH